MMAEAGFADVVLEDKPESRQLIAGWMPGSGAEDFVSSVIIRGTKPLRRS